MISIVTNLKAVHQDKFDPQLDPVDETKWIYIFAYD